MEFIRSSNLVKTKIHLVKWDIIARPIGKGGWGLKNMFKFSLALRARSLWLDITSGSLWKRVLHGKYFNSFPSYSGYTIKRNSRRAFQIFGLVYWRHLGFAGTSLSGTRRMVDPFGWGKTQSLGGL